MIDPAHRATPLCGSCAPLGRCRLGAGAIAIDGQRASVEAECAELFHAGPRVAHGGWTAALFDDVLGRSLMQRGLHTVTGTLTVDFLKPVPIKEKLLVEIDIDSHEGRKVALSATLRLYAGGKPLAHARGTWIERRPDHFARHEAEMRARRLDESERR